MKPIPTTAVITQKKNCEWIVKQAQELKALLAYNEPKMIALNRTRALSGIDTMMEALEELKQYVMESEFPDNHMPPGLFSNKPPVQMRSFMFTLPPFGKLDEETSVYVEYWKQPESDILSYRVFTQLKWVSIRYFIGTGICRCPVLFELNQTEDEASAIILDILQNKLVMDGIQDWYMEQNSAQNN